MKRKAIWIGIVVVALAAAAWTFTRPKAETAPTGGTAVAKKGDYRITVSEEGAFSSRNSQTILIASQAFHQQMTITKIVEEGALVKKDDVLIEVDTTEIAKIIAQAELEVQAGRNDVVQADETLKIQKIQNQINSDNVENAVRFAEMDIKKWKDIEEPKRIKQAEIRIGDTEQAMTDQEAEVDYLKAMIKEDLVSPLELRKAEIALRSAKTNFELAKLDMRLLMEYDLPKENADRAASLVTKKLNRDSQKSADQSFLVQKQSACIRAGTALKQKEDYLKKLKDDQVAMTVKAPTDGIVLYGDPKMRMYYGYGQTQELKVGGKIFPRNPLLTIPDLSAYRVILQINEGDINKVKNDLLAEIKPEAIPNTTFMGKVTRVSRISGQQQWWSGDSGSSKFDVEIDLDTADPRLRPGMKCKVEVLIEEVKGVVHVPVDAIFEKDGKTICYVVGSGAEPRVVKTGRANVDVIEILEGLKDGEKVTLYDPARSGKQ
jgi:HlyD family secretion protein